ncbi:nuclease-related domain-containing protein [Methylotuvimicrobium buryatense]|uniref:nuclease-related domain-containing protein n=1 Tax=Methylotuvimicrobium buryatense TaxID=95641 RepID=UPI000345E3FF|nr:nuclease-related domain-containing protein [Methylotuvimicrobium buryatense]
MDINQILIQAFAPLISVYWWLITLLFLLAFLKSPFMKGILGEFLVNLAAKFFLDKNIYRLFKNVTLPTEDGTTQIDHVIVSRYGVFVIETKNMKGWIFGSSQQKTWTQKIYRHTSKFQNPLHQNYKHTQTLQSALELDPEKMFSLVVFVGDSTFKTPMPDNVVYAVGYIRFIKSKTQPIISDSQVMAICDKIASGRLKPSLKTHREHVRHVKEIVEEKQRPIDDNSCTKCGKPMVLRTARNGDKQGKQFWGCSGFPKCRAVRQIS